jgi:hypothetical protein
MHPLIDNLLWASAFAGELLLLVILIFRRHYSSFPFFTSLTAFNVAREIALFVIRERFSHHAYFVTYWALVIPDYLLQVGILYEIARNALFPTHRRTPTRAFWILGILVLLSVLITAWTAGTAKAAAPLWIDKIIDVTNLAFSLLRCLLFASISVFSQVLGISWRNYVQRIATGLAIYSLIDFVVDYELMMHENSTLDYYRIAAYLISLAFWICTLYLPEPKRRPLAPQVEELVYRVHRAVTSDRQALESLRNRK